MSLVQMMTRKYKRSVVDIAVHSCVTDLQGVHQMTRMKLFPSLSQLWWMLMNS